MLFSTKAEYGVRLMVELGRQPSSAPISLSTVAEAERLAAFYPRLGDALKRRFAGWRCYFFTADRRLEKLIRLAPSRRIPLYNGPIDCRLYEFEIVAGARRRGALSQSPGPAAP